LTDGSIDKVWESREFKEKADWRKILKWGRVADPCLDGVGGPAPGKRGLGKERRIQNGNNKRFWEKTGPRSYTEISYHHYRKHSHRLQKAPEKEGPEGTKRKGGS